MPLKQQECLNLVGEIEEAMVDGAPATTQLVAPQAFLTPRFSSWRCAGFPFDIPAPYDTMPALKGRAEVEMTVKLKEGRASNPNIKRGTLSIVLDGFNAPVSAGNFMDLIVRGCGGPHALCLPRDTASAHRPARVRR